MSDIFTTIIIADSRGRGLEDFVGAHPTPVNHEYVFQIRPGKSLAQLAPIIVSTLDNYDSEKSYCIVLAGICGLTDKENNKGTKALRYKSAYRDDKVSCIIDTAKFLKESFNDRINICSIVPADLIKYFRLQNLDTDVPDCLILEQQALEEDINTINKVLLEINSSKITNINISSRCQIKSKKKRQRSGSKVLYRRVAKFTYAELTDGVHFSESLKNQAFTLIINTAIRDITTTLCTSHFEEAHRQQPRPVGFQNLRVTIENQPSSDSDSD